MKKFAGQDRIAYLIRKGKKHVKMSEKKKGRGI